MYDTGIKKWIFYIIIGVLAVALVGTILISKNISNKQKKEIENLNSTIKSMQKDTATVYATTEDVKAGAEVDTEKVTAVELPQSSIPENAITDESELNGKEYKIALKANSYLTKDMLLDYKLKENYRELDVVCNETPIGLEVGDYVDIRIAFPEGQTYVGMAHKKVVGISNNTLKLIVNEHDHYRYESMKTDVSLYNSTRIYADKYVEPGLQKSAKIYYPLRFDIAKQSLHDPNIRENHFMKLIKLRKDLETQLANAGHMIDKNQTVTDRKIEIQQEYSNAKEEYEEVKAEQEAESAAE